MMEENTFYRAEFGKLKEIVLNSSDSGERFGVLSGSDSDIKMCLWHDLNILTARSETININTLLSVEYLQST